MKKLIISEADLELIANTIRCSVVKDEENQALIDPENTFEFEIYEKLISHQKSVMELIEKSRGDEIRNCCKACRFWDAFYEDEKTGEGAGHCVRYAPRPVIGKAERDGEENVVWPITRENQGCGEFGLPNESGDARRADA